ncbi:MAG: DUF975 family protein [Kiritimatiellae bacterium]|nr:DUF975 family protein [Kiritimatiellia bacterium]
MRTCKEIRREAWQITTRTAWPWKIILNYLALQAVTAAALLALGAVYDACEIQTFEDFREAQRAAKAAGIEMAVASTREACRMFAATAFAAFIQYLFASIAAFGMAVTLLKCLKNEADRWFSDAFGGFLRPFETLWLLVLMFLKILLWTLLLFIPGIIATFRYMLAWYVKAENPDWGALRCIRRSCEIMAGRKWKAFCLVLSYLPWFLLALVPLFFAGGLAGALHSTVGEASLSILLVLALCSMLPLLALAMVYFNIGLTVFYRDAKAEAQGAEEPPAPGAV